MPTNHVNENETQSKSLEKIKNILDRFKHSTVQENTKEMVERNSEQNFITPQEFNERELTLENQKQLFNLESQEAFSFDEESGRPGNIGNSTLDNINIEQTPFPPTQAHISIDEREFEEDEDINQRESPKFTDSKPTIQIPESRSSQLIPKHEQIFDNSIMPSNISQNNQNLTQMTNTDDNLQIELENQELQKVNKILLSTIESLEKELNSSKRNTERLELDNKKLINAKTELYQEKEDLIRR